MLIFSSSKIQLEMLYQQIFNILTNMYLTNIQKNIWIVMTQLKQRTAKWFHWFHNDMNLIVYTRCQSNQIVWKQAGSVTFLIMKPENFICYWSWIYTIYSFRATKLLHRCECLLQRSNYFFRIWIWDKVTLKNNSKNSHLSK